MLLAVCCLDGRARGCQLWVNGDELLLSSLCVLRSLVLARVFALSEGFCGLRAVGMIVGVVSLDEVRVSLPPTYLRRASDVPPTRLPAHPSLLLPFLRFLLVQHSLQWSSRLPGSRYDLPSCLVPLVL